MSRIFSTRHSRRARDAMTLPVAPAYASYTITCNSNGYRYQYCSANTNGYARLRDTRRRKLPAYAGAAGGSDNGGVWVNSGCSAQFEVGGDSGAGAAMLALRWPQSRVAILGAIIAHHDREQDGDGYGPPPNYPVGGGPVPGWAVGTFNGSLRGQRQTIQIGPDGGVDVWYRNGGSAQGWFSGSSADDRQQRDERYNRPAAASSSTVLTSDADHP